MVFGGGFVNWSFLSAGLIDELSLVVAPVADGENNTMTLFEKSDYSPAHSPVEFTLQNVDMLNDGSVWLLYTIKNKATI